jgi:hypothetical protein
MAVPIQNPPVTPLPYIGTISAAKLLCRQSCKASQPAASMMAWTLQRWILSLGVIIQKWQYSVAQ